MEHFKVGLYALEYPQTLSGPVGQGLATVNLIKKEPQHFCHFTFF